MNEIMKEFMMQLRVTGLVLLAGLFFRSAGVQAAEEYVYRIPLHEIKMDGKRLDQSAPEPLSWEQRTNLGYFLPYASVDEGQAVMDFGSRILPRDFYQVRSVGQLIDNSSLLIKTSRKAPVFGVLFVPRSDLSGMHSVKFSVSAQAEPLSGEAGSRAFFAALQKHYDRLLQQDFAGDAWFRFQSIRTSCMLNQTDVFDPNTFQPAVSETRPDPFQSAYALFTGEQAVRENIQLDRTLQVFMNQPRTAEVSSIEGITTAQIDWAPLIAGGKIETDPLADYIPADQHAIFYPTFRSMMNLMDALREGRQRSELPGFSVDRLDDYEQQMCVWLDGWSRFWGPKTIRGVALTGSDPYMADGTDSAILFDAAAGGLVYNNTASKQKKKLKEIDAATSFQGTIDGIEYQAVVSPDRLVSSYLAQIDNVVVVTNSLVQLQKIVRASQKKDLPMSACDEYRFFRDRYDKKRNEQTAMVVLTDAAIRQWCSPRRRIGAARRQFAASLLAHAQAGWIDNPENFSTAEAQEFLSRWIPDIGTISLTRAGVTSSVYGNLLFLTPVAELPVDRVSPEEQRQYERFRDLYQRRWRAFFDPIGVCFLHEKRQSKIDLTVRPLIADSEYRQWMQIAGRNTLKPADGDPHPESIAHLVFAIDKDSEPIRQAGQFARQLLPAEADISAFGWLGRWIAVYIDDSAFWNEFSNQVKAKGMKEAFEKSIEHNLNAIPLAIAAEVESPVRLSAFLIALRTWIEQTLPGMTTWQPLDYNNRPYTQVTIRMSSAQSPPASIYYAVMPGQLIVTLDESMIRRAIDRAGAKQKTPDWAGDHIAVRVSEKGWSVVELIARESYGRWLQRKAWSNLPILTEWHAHAGKLTESEFHRQFWNASLDSPSGTDYVWNKDLRAVQSTLYGHPAVPKMPREIKTPLTDVKQADIGITFEEDGLRAVTRLERKK
jgi:hypothetical protein